MVASLDEDTVIVLGFSLATVALLVLIFVWVMVHCLCCRRRARYPLNRILTKRMRYLSTDKGASLNSTLSTSRLGDLPQIPSSEITTLQMSPPGHLPNNYLNGGFEDVENDHIYSYCDAPCYQAPVPRDVHAYEGMPNGTRLDVSRQAPEVVCRKESNGEAYVDILCELPEDDGYDDNLPEFERETSIRTVVADVEPVVEEVNETAEPQIVKDSPQNAEHSPQNVEHPLQNAENSLRIVPRPPKKIEHAPQNTRTFHTLPVDNSIYFVNSDSDSISCVSSESSEYKDPCTAVRKKEDYYTLENLRRTENEDKEVVESNDGQPNSTEDVDLHNTDTSTYLKPPLLTVEIVELPEVVVKNRPIPVPKPRSRTVSVESITALDDSSTMVDSGRNNATPPEPLPRTTKAPANPPPYDQIVDYGQ